MLIQQTDIYSARGKEGNLSVVVLKIPGLAGEEYNWKQNKKSIYDSGKCVTLIRATTTTAENAWLWFVQQQQQQRKMRDFDSCNNKSGKCVTLIRATTTAENAWLWFVQQQQQRKMRDFDSCNNNNNNKIIFCGPNLWTIGTSLSWTLRYRLVVSILGT